MLSNLKKSGIFHIVSEPWRANISLYKNIFLYKNSYSTLLLAVANDQITLVCTQILMQAVMMVKLNRMEVSRRKYSLIISAFSPFNYRNWKTLMFSFEMKILHCPVSLWSQTLNEIGEILHLQLLELPVRASFWKKKFEP